MRFLAFIIAWAIATSALGTSQSHQWWVSVLIGVCGAVMYFAVAPDE